ncbi:Transcription factor bHLH30-like protein, partial [Drosera capensis]
MHHQASSGDHAFAALMTGGVGAAKIAAAATAGGSGYVFPEMPQNLPWSTNPLQGHGYVNHVHYHDHDHDPFLSFPPSSSSSSTTGLFTRRPLYPSPLFGYDGYCPPSDHHLSILADALGPMVQPTGSVVPFGLQAELSKMTAQEIMDAKALAASKSHSEAERRRRERINNHLAKLRSILPSTTKTDKASLLAEVIQHVKELKRQTSLIAESSSIPTETDELTVSDASDELSHSNKLVIKASLCCEDRSDILPDLIKTLKSLRLKTLKAEITTLGGRVKNVLFITEEEDPSFVDMDGSDQHQFSISSIQEALKAVMEKSGGSEDSTSGSAKRQRTN